MQIPDTETKMDALLKTYVTTRSRQQNMEDVLELEAKWLFDHEAAASLPDTKARQMVDDLATKMAPGWADKKVPVPELAMDTNPFFGAANIKEKLQPLIMKLLAERPGMYGHEMSLLIKSLSTEPTELTEGALFPVLNLMLQQGLIVTQTAMVNKRRRVYYSLSQNGSAKIKDAINELGEMAKQLPLLMNLNKPDQYVPIN